MSWWHRQGTNTGKITTSSAQLLGDKAEYLLNFKSPKIPKERLHLPGPDVVDRLYGVSDRNNRLLGNLQRIVGHGQVALLNAIQDVYLSQEVTVAWKMG
jgi:hypothetical protein